MERPRLAIPIWESVAAWRFEGDIFNDFLLRYSRNEIEKALAWLCERGLLTKLGSDVRPIYNRPERTYRYTNIAPLAAADAAVLLAMHQNFTGEQP